MRIIAVVIALALGGCTLSGLGAAAKIGKDSTVTPEQVRARPEYGKSSLQGECVPERIARIACVCPSEPYMPRMHVGGAETVPTPDRINGGDGSAGDPWNRVPSPGEILGETDEIQGTCDDVLKDEPGTWACDVIGHDHSKATIAEWDLP